MWKRWASCSCTPWRSGTSTNRHNRKRLSLVDSDTKGVGKTYPLRVECVQDRTTIRQCSRRLTASSASTGNGLHAAASPDLPRLPVGGAERKTGWEINGDADPCGIQYLLNRERWSVAEVRAALRGYVQEHLRGPRAVGIVDETAFLKKGIRSAGGGATVQRHDGTSGELSGGDLSGLHRGAGVYAAGLGTLPARRVDQRADPGPTATGSGPAGTGTKWVALHCHYRRQQATTLCSTSDQFRAWARSVASCRAMTSDCYGARLLSLGSIKFHTRS